MKHLFKLYNTPDGPALDRDGRFFGISCAWDDLLKRSDLPDYLAGDHTPIDPPTRFLPVARAQEVWASRSSSARAAKFWATPSATT